MAVSYVRKFNESYIRFRLLFVKPLSDLIIVTGADSSHSKSLCQFLYSVNKYEPDCTIIVYDLGLSEDNLEQITGISAKFIIEKFDFSLYPDYFDIKVNAGEYAWKPVIVKEAMDKYNKPICWMDAGNVLTGSLNTIRRIINLQCGVYSPISDGTIEKWTHPKMLNHYSVPHKLYKKPNRNGACIAFNNESRAARDILRRWAQCALQKECIAPSGSSRVNHRQDQAALTVLINLKGLDFKIPYRNYRFHIHRDID